MRLRRKREPAELPREELMTTTEVMWFLKYTSTRATTGWLRRAKVAAQRREPGPHGENLYSRAAVEAAKRGMPGRGHRTDLDGQAAG